MTWKQFFTSSLGKKYVMGLTGISLIIFLIVHLSINLTALMPDNGEMFNKAAHFMATNIIIRIAEVGLFAGIFLHIIQGLMLWGQNAAARPVNYAVNAANKNSKWYSRSMGLLGTLLLMFLIIHVGDFWVKSRFIGLEEVGVAGSSEPVGDLYSKMINTFTPIWMPVIYAFAMISLGYHLLHGFQSSFQSLGVNHKRYTPIIKCVGTGFSIIVPLAFAIIPFVIHFRHAA